MKKQWAAAAVLCFLLCLLPASVSAKIVLEPVYAVIPVEVAKDGTANEYQIHLKAADQDAPEAEKDVLTLKEGQTGEFRILFSEPGNFEYEIWEEDPKDPDIVPDTSQYLAAAAAFAEGEKLVPSVVIQKKESDNKADKVHFQNQGKPKPVTPQTGDRLAVFEWNLAAAAGLVGFLGTCLVYLVPKIRFQEKNPKRRKRR